MVQLDASAGSAGMFAEQLVNTDPCPQMVCSYSSCCYWWGGANQPRANSQTNKEVIPGLFRFHPDSLLISKTLHQFTQTRSSACVRDWQSKQKEQEVFLTLYVKSIITKNHRTGLNVFFLNISNTEELRIQISLPRMHLCANDCFSFPLTVLRGDYLFLIAVHLRLPAAKKEGELLCSLFVAA